VSGGEDTEGGEEDEADGGFEVVGPDAARAHGGGNALAPAAQQALHALKRLQV
jgi:hypothetical protein